MRVDLSQGPRISNDRDSVCRRAPLEVPPPAVVGRLGGLDAAPLRPRVFLRWLHVPRNWRPLTARFRRRDPLPPPRAEDAIGPSQAGPDCGMYSSLSHPDSRPIRAPIANHHHFGRLTNTSNGRQTVETTLPSRQRWHPDIFLRQSHPGKKGCAGPAKSACAQRPPKSVSFSISGAWTASRRTCPVILGWLLRLHANASRRQRRPCLGTTYTNLSHLLPAYHTCRPAFAARRYPSLSIR